MLQSRLKHFYCTQNISTFELEEKIGIEWSIPLTI